MRVIDFLTDAATKPTVVPKATLASPDAISTDGVLTGTPSPANNQPATPTP